MSVLPCLLTAAPHTNVADHLLDVISIGMSREDSSHSLVVSATNHPASLVSVWHASVNPPCLSIVRFPPFSLLTSFEVPCLSTCFYSIALDSMSLPDRSLCSGPRPSVYVT